jgi:hypothetical protein
MSPNIWGVHGAMRNIASAAILATDGNDEERGQWGTE